MRRATAPDECSGEEVTMRTATRIAALAVLLFGLIATSARAGERREANNTYRQHNLVSDGSVPADVVDHDLVNAWGVAFNPNGFVWVVNNGTSTSTLYDGTGAKAALVVTIPGGAPTGIVFNGSNDFKQRGQPARFIFASESGAITAWVPPAVVADLAVDNSASGALYKGLALGGNGAGHLLYATDFKNGRVDVFDANFAPVQVAGGFKNRFLPAGYAPFGIQNVNGDIVVTYARQDPNGPDEVAGPGNGYVAIFDADGTLLRHFNDHQKLNAPWGVALAPAGFGRFGGMLLIGNFGDGTIAAYDAASGEFRGQLRGTDKQVLKIEGLWGFAFGNGVAGQMPDTLYFAAGPKDETGGLYGTLTFAGSRD